MPRLFNARRKRRKMKQTDKLNETEKLIVDNSFLSIPKINHTDNSIDKYSLITLNKDEMMIYNSTINHENKGEVIDSSFNDYQENYNYICHLCNRRYSSLSGLNYHRNSFDHSNPPLNYDPTKISKRGRPRGFRLYHTSRKSSNSEITPYKRHRKRSISFNPNVSSSNMKPIPSQLTYAESQRIVEIEHNNSLYRIPIDYKCPLIIDENDLAMPSSNKINGKKFIHVPKAIFSKKFVYNHPTSELILQNQSCKIRKNIEKEKSNNNYHYVNNTPISLFKDGNYKNEFESQYLLPNMFKIQFTYYHLYDNICNNPDEVVEYEMDEEDVEWLKRVNIELSLSMPASQFEYIMDRFEKQSSYIVKTTDGSNVFGKEEDIVCGVCLDGDCSNTNLIVFCDICNVAVHQDCYGLPYVPEGQWLCRRCSHAPSREIKCVLCPIKTGVFKQTHDGNWCHIICAIMIPGVKFPNVVFLEPIDYSDISRSRFNVLCILCSQSEGAVIQCYYQSCTLTFHASCAQLRGLAYLERTETGKKDESGNLIISQRYVCYCQKHLPENRKLAIPLINENLHVKETIRQNKYTTAPAVVHVPMVSDELVIKLASKLDIPNAISLVDTVKRYWQLKRYMRSGVPILRRFTRTAKHPVYSFKLKDNQLKMCTNYSELIEKMSRFSSSINDCIQLLTLLSQRESLKISLAKMLKRFLSLPSDAWTSFFNKLFVIIETSLSDLKCKVNPNKFKSILFNRFSYKFLCDSDRFEEYILSSFQEYSKEKIPIDIIEEIELKLKQYLKRRTLRRKSSFIVPEDLEIIPSNLDMDQFVHDLTQDLSGNNTDFEDLDYTLGETVWAKMGRCRYFPSIIDEFDDEGNNAKVYKVGGSINNCVWVPVESLQKLGISSDIDGECISLIINSKSHDRELKRNFIDSYQIARNMSP